MSEIKNLLLDLGGVVLDVDYHKMVDTFKSNILAEDNPISLYPNPTNKDVNISSENIINSIEVFNSFGQRIYQEKAKSKERTIDISFFSKGVYIIGVSTDMGYIRKKLIKN